MTSFDEVKQFYPGDRVEYNHHARQYRYLLGAKGTIISVKSNTYDDGEYSYKIKWDKGSHGDLTKHGSYMHHILKFVEPELSSVTEPSEDIYNDLI